MWSLPSVLVLTISLRKTYARSRAETSRESPFVRDYDSRSPPACERCHIEERAAELHVMAADPTMLVVARRCDLSGRPFRVISLRRPRSSAATGAPQQADTIFRKIRVDRAAAPRPSQQISRRHSLASDKSIRPSQPVARSLVRFIQVYFGLTPKDCSMRADEAMQSHRIWVGMSCGCAGPAARNRSSLSLFGHPQACNRLTCRIAQFSSFLRRLKLQSVPPRRGSLRRAGDRRAAWCGSRHGSPWRGVFERAAFLRYAVIPVARKV